jgi:hypothetical protein
MSDILTERVTDAVREASPYWGDHLILSESEAHAAIAAVLQHLYEEFINEGEWDVESFAVRNGYKLAPKSVAGTHKGTE